MAITTYSELQTAITNWTHDTTGVLSSTQLQEFIALAEADLKVRAKLTQWEATTTVSVTSGSGTLPTGCDHVHTVLWASQTDTLDYVPYEQFKRIDAANSGGGTPYCYTIFGDTLLVAPSATDTATVAYTARFTSLSGSSTTNSLLDLFPDAYLHGSLYYAFCFRQDDANANKHLQLFESAIERIRKYTFHRRYPGGLVMRNVEREVV